MQRVRDGISAVRRLAGIVSFVVMTAGVTGSPGLFATARADQPDAPPRRDAKPGRPRMEALPPAEERPPRRPFDEVDGGADPPARQPARGPRRLGTIFAPVPDAVREQIDLPEGVGLLAETVEPGGAAAAAGLKRFDILTRFNDQIVCNADQLATLIKLRKPGPVSVTILRGGRERKLQVVLPQGDPAEERMPLAEAPERAPGFPPGADLQRQVEDLTRRMQQQPFAPGGGGGRSRTTRMSVSPQGNERIDTESDGTTTIEIRQSAGRMTVEIRGADGARIHAGKLDTDADRRRVPEAFQDRVARLVEEITGARR